MHAHAHPDAGPDAADLLQHLQVHLVGLSAATELLGVGEAQQPGAAQGGEHLAREHLVGLGGDHPGGELGAGDVAGQLEEVGGLLGGDQTLDRHGGHLSSVLQDGVQYRR